MKWLLGLGGVLVACSPSGSTGGDHQRTRADVESFRGFAISPNGERFAEVDYVSGGGAAGYVGIEVSMTSIHKPTRDIAFVHERSSPVATWRSDTELVVTGCFDDYDETNFEPSMRAPLDGVVVRYENRCR